MKKYASILLYKTDERRECTNVEFEKTNVIPFENINHVISISGDAPHSELTKHDGHWKITGDNVLPNSYFFTKKRQQ